MIDLNVVNDERNFPISEEERLLNEAKPLAFNAIKSWIENVSRKPFLYSNDFRKSLADGVLLCNLLNCLKPGSIKRVNTISTPIAGYDNIGKFLRCCEEDFGLSPLILFKISDLEDLTEKFSNSQLESGKRLERVLICLFHLAKSVENHLTTFVIDSAPFSLLLKSQDFREMKKIKSLPSTELPVSDSSVPEIIQKQVPNYLANKAEETLQLTKVNQDILKKSGENDDWQESLENWRERRRQALSQSLVESVSVHTDGGDNKDLIKLKEKARQMKQLRDQIKDQNIQPANETLSTTNSVPIPDIDDETKALIERVKQKKLAEEKKRQYSAPSPTMTSFASDSELSNSLAVDKHEEDTLSVSEKEEGRHSSAARDQLKNDLNKTNVSETNESHQKGKSKENDKTRIIQVKLSQRFKQDSNQLWGMELTDRCGKIFISKVKIGSSSDVCEVKKNDEIVSINSRNVSNQSIECVKSIFHEYASTISASEFITLSLRRLNNEDQNEEDDEEFLSENLSESIEEKPLEKSKKFEINNGDILHLTENNIESIVTNIENLDNINDNVVDSETDQNILMENPKEYFQSTSRNPAISKVVENIPNYKDNSSAVDNISTIRPEIPNLSETNRVYTRNRNETDLRVSVQDKIAKFESQRLSNPAILSSSLNVSKNSPDDSSFMNTKYHHQTSCPWLPLNADISNSKPISSLQHYWETEAPKSLSSSHQDLSINNGPIMQHSLNSSIRTSQNGSTIGLEAYEQQLDTPNVNNIHSLRRFPSSGNSSTSDDVSALNETIIMSQYGYKNKANNSSCQGPGNGSISNEDKALGNNLPKKHPISDSDYPIRSKPSSNNVSTGIQANLQNREPPVYTTITTSFENPSKRSFSNSVSKISDDENSYSMSSSKLPEKNTGHRMIAKQQSFPQYRCQMLTSKNEMSKDLTTVTSVLDGYGNKNKSEKITSLSTGSNISRAFDDNERSLELEVSVMPQLFPMRNKTLFTRSSEEKPLRYKSSDSITLERSFDDDENTLKSDYIKVTNLDDVISPIRERANTSFGIDNIVVSSLKEELIIPSTIKTENFSSSSTNKGKEIPKINNSDKRPKSQCSEVLESQIDTEPSVSTIPAPTLFKGGPKSENTLSVAVSYSKSDNINSLRSESNYSSRKPNKKSNSKTGEGLDAKRSSSTKDLRCIERGDSVDKNKPNTANRDNPVRSSSNHRKNSPSQVTFSNIVQDITETKSHTKTYSIEKSTKTVPTLVREKKKPKSQNRKSCPAEISTKCNNCSQPAGSEDLMVIEELNLHFHLRCFICSECKVQLGDGKSDTDVRIRRSKLHCTKCYNKKSSKSKHRNSFPNQILPNNIQTKETEI